MDQKENFRRFLRERFPAAADAAFRRFEAFHAWLVDENAKINLFSRRTDPEDIWTVHFLDSLSSTLHVDFGERKILDFGTGGGMPGIPLAIVHSDSEVTLLDSTTKKIAALMRAVEYLELRNCQFIDRRLEEIGNQYQSRFDLIVSRAVKIEPAYKPVLLKLLRPHGKIVLYKSKILDDVRQFGDNARIFDVGNEITGERKIVVVSL